MGEVTKVTPLAGTVVIFEHDLFHSGAPLLWGTKYVLRTDIVFAANRESGETRCYEEKRPPPSSIAFQSEEEPSTRILVSDLVDKLNLSRENREILARMDMLDITINAFVSPGVSILKRVLKDSMIDDDDDNESIVELLVD